MNHKILLLGFIFFVLYDCSSFQNKEKCIRKVQYTCVCNSLEAKQIGMIRLLDDELEIYKVKKNVVLAPEVEDEIFQVPSVYLENFYFQEQASSPSLSSSIKERTFIAKGNLNEKKLENYLKTQKVEVIDNKRVYSRRGTGQRGLELILNYSKERQKQKSVDKDRYYRDRIDMLKKIKE